MGTNVVERNTKMDLTLFMTEFFGATQGWGEGGPKVLLPKICHTYPVMMKLGTVIIYQKKIQKIYESCDTALEFCGISIFSPEISKLCYIIKYMYRLHFDT